MIEQSLGGGRTLIVMFGGRLEVGGAGMSSVRLFKKGCNVVEGLEGFGYRTVEVIYDAEDSNKLESCDYKLRKVA